MVYERVALKTCALGAGERGVAEQLLELDVVHCLERREVGRHEFGARRECGFSGGQRELMVPRAHLLANVTPEQVVTHHRRLLRRVRASQFDGQVRDALAGIEYIWRHERLRGTRV
jgi:hypothetical protein